MESDNTALIIAIFLIMRKCADRCALIVAFMFQGEETYCICVDKNWIKILKIKLKELKDCCDCFLAISIYSTVHMRVCDHFFGIHTKVISPNKSNSYNLFMFL